MPGEIWTRLRYPRENGRVVAISDEFDIAASGATEAEAKAEFQQAFAAVIAAAEQEGVLQDYLANRVPASKRTLVSASSVLAG